MKLYLFFFPLLLFCLTSCNSTYQVANSKTQVNNLEKDGCLFVRLHYFPNRIKKLEEMGYKIAVAAEKKKIAEANKSMMSAFKENWDFSPVYFIFPEESYKVANSDIDSINFLNSDLENDPSIKCECDNILIVEEGRVQKDTTLYLDGSYMNKGENGWERKYVYHTDSSQPVQGLVVKSSEFIQLHKPFPFYTRRFKFFLRRTDETLVKELNHRFHQYYKIANKK